MKKITTLILLILVFVSCKQNQSEPNSFVSETVDNQEEEFPDGEYCAEVNYYNPNTGTSSTYNLPVEVENGELVKIQWLNDGWLDSSHFYPPDIADGTASFDDDRGREYKVELLESGNCNGSSSYVEEEENNEKIIDDENSEDVAE
jgi:hypothetical protein